MSDGPSEHEMRKGTAGITRPLNRFSKRGKVRIFAGNMREKPEGKHSVLETDSPA
jgi:hypothetical protein